MFPWRFFAFLVVLVLLLSAGWFFFGGRGEVVIKGEEKVMIPEEKSGENLARSETPELKLEKEKVVLPVKKLNQDLEFQARLSNPPEVVKAIYATGWSAGSRGKVDSLIKLIDETELNAIVIDVKDYSGFISYEIDTPILKDAGAFGELRILKPNELIKKLHDKNIYVIARVSVFQDPILAKAHPEWAVQSSSTGKTWKDRKGLAWMDPSAREVWEYNLEIAKDALARGFDEVNFDYIRFPSDGDLEDAIYPFWDDIAPRSLVIENFFRFLRENLKERQISVDLFGLTTIANDDLGIGQILEKALPYFDFVAPMVYPSHFANGTMGYKNPAENPYEIVKGSIESAVQRLVKYSSLAGTSTEAGLANKRAVSKIRPWFQDFDLGADYDAVKVRAQIDAVEDVFCGPAPSPDFGDSTNSLAKNNSGSVDQTMSGNRKGRDAQICDSSSGGLGDKFGGWMLWDPRNVYTRSALHAD